MHSCLDTRGRGKSYQIDSPCTKPRSSRVDLQMREYKIKHCEQERRKEITTHGKGKVEENRVFTSIYTGRDTRGRSTQGAMHSCLDTRGRGKRIEQNTSTYTGRNALLPRH